MIDSGAEVGVTPRSLVTGESVECGEVHISEVHGKTSVHQSTIVTYELGGLGCAKLAVIDEREKDDIISIIFFDVLNEEEVKSFSRAISESKSDSAREVVEAKVKVVTKSQARIEKELEKCDDLVVEDLRCVVEGEESVPEVFGVEKEHSVEGEEVEPMQKSLSECVVEGNDEVSSEPKELDRIVGNDSEKEMCRLASEIGLIRSGSCVSEFREAVMKDESLVERPLLSEPFESCAIDIVGLLPKAKEGMRFIFTYICMASTSKWPEAMPLRTVTSKNVAEALMLIFSRTSIPEVILTDQGSQFESKLMSDLCACLGINKIRTSPYHPQTNGCIERMHCTFKSILAKCEKVKLDWASQVPYVLFVLRQLPHQLSWFMAGEYAPH